MTESRLRVRLPAVLTTHDGTRRVTLEDLSAGGARISGPIACRTGQEALLEWGPYGAFGEVCWTGDGDCGIRFLDPVPACDLLATRDLPACPGQTSERDRMQRTAAAFVRGRLRL